MNVGRIRWRQSYLFLGVGVWSLIFLGCVMVQRTMLLPPTIPGASFAGSESCAECHDNVTSSFHDATHARLMAPGASPTEIGCEACHGPGSLHIESGGTIGTIVNPQNSPETCFQCHLDKRGEFALPHAHPLGEGKLACSSCHDSHSGDATLGGGMQLASANDTCFECHSAQEGPFVFEHEASREGCVVCHSPHGSVNDKMLKSRNQTLCLQCHFQEQTTSGGLLIGGRDHASFVTRGTCWTAGCHEAVHGSHVNSSLRF